MIYVQPKPQHYTKKGVTALNMSNYSTKDRKSQPKDVEWAYTSITSQNDCIHDVVRTSYTPKCYVRKVSKELYLVGTYRADGKFESTGEVHEVRKKVEPMRNRRSLKKIMRDLRQLIAHNFEGGEKELFVTLTYAQQTNDPKQVLRDFHAFIKRLRRRYEDYDLSYLSVVEPHASGMFHIHMLLKTNSKDTLFIPNDVMAATWGHGFTETERLADIDHMGAYVIAYMSNAELSPEQIATYEAEGDIVECKGKKYIKGKRLDFYPDGMQIYRHSKDVERPPKYTGQEAEGEIFLAANLGQKLVFSRTKEIETTDRLGNKKTSYVLTEQYKTKKLEKGDEKS